MTTEQEEHYALIQARQFLVDLMDPKKTPRVPKYVREEARARVKHFPIMSGYLEKYGPHHHDHLDTPRWILLMPHDHDHLTMMYIDPPSGWMYGFPKEAPANLREMNDDQLNEWLVSNGYPQEEVERWSNSVPCRFFERKQQ